MLQTDEEPVSEVEIDQFQWAPTLGGECYLYGLLAAQDD